MYFCIFAHIVLNIKFRLLRSSHNKEIPFYVEPKISNKKNDKNKDTYYTI